MSGILMLPGTAGLGEGEIQGEAAAVIPARGKAMHILWWAIVGLIAGWVTGKIMKGSGYGPLMDIIVGIAGAMLGGFLMRMVGFAGEGGMIYTILVAILGAVILTAIVRFFTGKTA
jgi:uncharacterized membrane protein YeaQ/YmgE (transglycosylase-associated protein family)